MSEQTYISQFDESRESESTARRSPLVIGVVALVLIGMVVLFVVDRLYNPQQFRIEQVEVIGQFEHVNAEQVRDLVADALDGNYFSAELGGIETRIRNIPWVYDASVRRQWPSTLKVQIEEVQPIAEWGDKYWLNASGDLVDREEWAGNLPLLDGPAAMQETVWNSFNKWHEMFAVHGISLDRLELDERELWYLTLSLTALAMDRNELVIEAGRGQAMGPGEVVLIVDNINPTARIERLMKALNSELIAEFPGMKSIDLRYPNGFAINWIKRPPDPQNLSDSN